MENNRREAKPFEHFECIFPAFDVSNYDSEKFEEILGDYVAESLIECQNEAEMIEFNSKLKEELIYWVSCSAKEPWNHSDSDSDIAPFVSIALKMITDKEEFKQSDEFVDSLLNYVGNVAPFHKQSAKELIELTESNVSDEANAKMIKLYEGLGQKRKTDEFIGSVEFGALFPTPEDDFDFLYQISGLNSLFPDKEIFAQAQELAKDYLARIVAYMYMECGWPRPTMENLIKLNKIQQEKQENIRRLNPICFAEVMQLSDYLSENLDDWLNELDEEWQEYSRDSNEDLEDYEGEWC